MRSDGIRRLGDEGQKFHLFDGWKVLIETDPGNIVKDGNTKLEGCIHATYINLEEKTGLVCVDISVGQRYWPNNNSIIGKPFSLLIEPYQVISIIDNHNCTHIGSDAIFGLLSEGGE